MFDPFFNTPADSVPFFLREDTLLCQPSGSAGTRFESFEYLRTDSVAIFFAPDTVSASSGLPVSGYEGVALPLPQFEGSVIFLVFAFCFLVFAFFFNREGAALRGNFKNILSFNNRRKGPIYKEQITATELWGELFLILQTILIAAIVTFTYLWDNELPVLSPRYYYLFFAGILLLLLLLMWLKYLVYKSIGTFFLHLEMDDWIDRYLWMVEMIGIVCFIPALIFVYLQEFRDFMLIVFVFVFFVSRLIIAGGILNIFVKNKIGFLYFIVYLCGVELVPYLLLYKGAVSLISIVGDIVL